VNWSGTRLRPARTVLTVIALTWALALTSHAQAPQSIFDEDPSASTPPQIPDRVEGFNRAMFRFNDGLYKVTLRPLAKGYVKVMPAPLRRGFSTFFHNLEFPIRFVGNILEGKPGGAAVETGRFVMNSITSLGFVATADDVPQLKERPSDLGRAFGTWGVGHGTYLVLPLLGPTSLRDGTGQLLSGYLLDPVHYVQGWESRAGINAFRITNESPELMDSYDQLKSAAIDPYVALRDAYSSRRSLRHAEKPESPAIPAAASTVTPP
jgi:phospholipid-binding lipoprotein MlaA